MRKPTLFIASSSHTKKVAQVLSHELKHIFVSTVWSDSFIVSVTNIDNLRRIIGQHDYGLCIFADDDTTHPRKDPSEEIFSPRDNVVFEAGMLIAKLGLERCFIVVPDEIKQRVKIPTDISGLVLCSYSRDDFERNLHAQSVSQTCLQIATALKSSNDQEGESQMNIPRKLDGLWLSCFRFHSSRGPSEGVQYNVENLKFRGDTFVGENLKAWNSVKARRYLHQLEGRVIGRFLMGTWKNTGAWNVGSFQFVMNAAMDKLDGRWLGSDSENAIHTDEWHWVRLCDYNSEIFPKASSDASTPSKVFAPQDVIEQLDQIMRDPDGERSVEKIIKLTSKT